MKSVWDVVAGRKSCSGKLGGSATFADLLERESRCRLCFLASLLVTSREITKKYTKVQGGKMPHCPTNCPNCLVAKLPQGNKITPKLPNCQTAKLPSIVATPAMGTEAGLAPLRPDECLDLDLWDHIFDDTAVAKRSPLRTLARDMRAQLEVTPGIPPHVATRIRRHLPRLNHPD